MNGNPNGASDGMRLLRRTLALCGEAKRHAAFGRLYLYRPI